MYHPDVPVLQGWSAYSSSTSSWWHLLGLYFNRSLLPGKNWLTHRQGSLLSDRIYPRTEQHFGSIKIQSLFPNLEQICRITLTWNLLVKSTSLFAATITVPLLQISASFAFSWVLRPNTVPNKIFRKISTSHFNSWKNQPATSSAYC